MSTQTHSLSNQAPFWNNRTTDESSHYFLRHMFQFAVGKSSTYMIYTLWWNNLGCTAVCILSTCFFQRHLNLSASVFECFEVGSAQELRAIWRYIKSQRVQRNTPSTAYAKGGPWYVTVYRKVGPAFAIGDPVPKYDKYTCRLVATTSLIFSTSRKGILQRLHRTWSNHRHRL